MSRALIVFLKYKNRKEIFTNGTILYHSEDVLQAINDDEVEWDELKLIKYSSERAYNDDVAEFDKVKNELVNYRVILVNLYSRFKQKIEFMKYTTKNLIFSDDTSINLAKRERPSQKRKRTAGSAPNIKNRQKFGVLFKDGPIFLVNLIKYHNIAHYPEGYEGKQVSGEEAFLKYVRIAYKYNKKHKNYFKFTGEAVSTIADNTGKETKWHNCGIVKYASRESMQKFISEKAFQQSIEHKDASLEATYVYACFLSG